MSFGKRFLILSNPATGQLNPLLAISEELCLRGHQVILGSSDPVLRKVQKLQTRFGQLTQTESIPTSEFLSKVSVAFYSLGSGEALDDYTDHAFEDPERFHKYCRSRPGEIWGWLKTFTELVPPSSAQYEQVVYSIRDFIESLNPDMIIVDNFSPFAVDGVRLSKRPFIETSPGASSAVANNIDLFSAPMPMSGGRDARGGFIVFIHNLVFVLMWLKFVLFNPWAVQRRSFRREVLGLEPLDIICDSIMTPTPGMVKEQVATISFNVANMDFYSASAYDRSVYFVGPCFPPKQTRQERMLASPSTCSTPTEPTTPLSIASTPTVAEVTLEKELFNMQTINRLEDPVKLWLDQAHLDNKRVVYINMGSIFFYSRQDYDNIVKAMEYLHDLYPNVMVLWKIPKLPYSAQPIPSADEARLPLFIRREDWLQSVETVLSHPAVSVVMHHGGGNSYNEAILYGLPQFCVSQWVDTHDIGSYIQHSGVGLWADKSPAFDPIDMGNKLVELLEDKDGKFKMTTLTWKLKALQAGGTKVAADIIETYTSTCPSSIECTQSET